MANILGFDTASITPDFGFGVTGQTLTIIFIVFALFVVGAIMIWLLFHYRTYNRKIIVFENISGQGYQPILKDRARLIRLGDGGEELLYLRQKKVYRTAYGKKMGKNTYWFAVGQDGYWYNIVLGDLDAKMGMLDIEPIDRDMRYMHVAVRKNIQDRYKKIKFMEKYGTIVMNSAFLIIMLIGMFFMFNKIGEVATTVNAGVDASLRVVEATENIMSSLSNICTGGPGYIPVT